MKQQFYFKNEDTEECYTKEHFQDVMRADKLTEIEVLEAVKSKDTNYFWCSYVGTSGERGECGKQCDMYKPRNGVWGACVYLVTLYSHGEKITLKL